MVSLTVGQIALMLVLWFGLKWGARLLFIVAARKAIADKMGGLNG